MMKNKFNSIEECEELPKIIKEGNKLIQDFKHGLVITRTACCVCDFLIAENHRQNYCGIGGFEVDPYSTPFYRCKVGTGNEF